MKEIGIDEARALVSNQILWPRVRDCLWNFAPQVHESWLEGLGREALDVSSPSSSPRIRRFVLASLGVTPCFHDFPREDGSRLALLEGKTLELVAKWMGAIFCAAGLRRITSGATVRALKAALPGIYPEVFGYTAYFGWLDAWRPDSAEASALDASVVLKTGVAVLKQLLSSVPEPLLLRVALKLPKGVWDAEAAEFHADGRHLTLQTSVIKLFKLKFPEAYELCCS